MCRWMGSHFRHWIDYNGVAFSIVTRMGSHIFGFFGVRVLYIYGYQMYQNVSTVDEK